MQCSQRRGGEYDGQGERERDGRRAGWRSHGSLSLEEDTAVVRRWRGRRRAVIRFSRGGTASCAPGKGRDVDLVGWVGRDVNMVRSN